MSSTCNASYGVDFEEEVDIRGWDKQTVRFICDNKYTINKWIITIYYSVAKRHPTEYDIEEIAANVNEYAYSHEEFNSMLISKNNNSSNVTFIGIEGYIKSFISFCTKRYVSEQYKINKEYMDVKETDENNINVFEILSLIKDEAVEKHFEDCAYKMDEKCKQYECKRYFYGMDIFQMLFIRLLSDNNDDVFKTIMSAIGVDSSTINSVKKYMCKDSDNMIVDLVIASVKIGTTKALELIGKYVFDKESIIKAVKVMCNE